MWKHYGALACALIATLLASTALLATADDPSTLPLVQFADLLYTGAFRLPDAFVNGDGFTIGGRPITYNPDHNSLFIGSRLGRIAEVTIPSAVNSAQVTALPFASFLQGFYDPTEGNLWQIASDGVSIDGILVQGDRLYGSASIYYDANNTQRLSHYSRSTTLSTPSFVGMSQVWQPEMTGFVSGYMANVPAEWQQRLGGTAITGQCCLPIAWRTSWGPSAFAWNPPQIGAVTPVPATPLLYYSGEHHTLGHWDGSGPAYGGTTQINGVALIAGTRTALFVGRNGTGPFCYGNGTSIQSLVGTIGPDHEIYCYDPSSPAKGQHAYPYQYQIWAYDLNDLAAVKAGTKQPWDVLPYGVWPFSLPTPEPMVRIGGIGYDPSRQVIYLSQLLADQDGYGYRPIIHVLKIGSAPVGTAPVPVPAPAPAPAPTTRVTTVALAANLVAPQPPGTTVTFTASPNGGTLPLLYKWWIYNGAWQPIGSWTTSRTFAWTPATTYPAGRITVWAKSAANSADEAEASTAMDFVISGSAIMPPPLTPAPTTSSSRVTTVAISANKTAPQAPGTTVTFSAAALNGGAAPLQYKWWIYDGAWKTVGSWTTSSTFGWTPAVTYPAGRVTVWVRSATNTTDEAEASTAMDFVISGAAVVTPSPAPAPTPAPTPASARVTAVTIGADMIAPRAAGSTVRFSATPTGGGAPYQYKWWTYDGAWKPVDTWTTSSTFAWTPSTAYPGGRITVWVRSASNTADEAEAAAAMDFVITASTAATPSSTVSSATLIANQVAPQPRATAITFTASPNGGIAPQHYKFRVWDGAAWLVLRGWSTSNTATWFPALAGAYYKVEVWVKSAGNSADAAEATAWLSFPIQ